MSPLSALALSGLLALSLSDASPIPPRTGRQGARAGKRSLPSLSVVQRFSTAAPEPGAMNIADADRARFAGHLTRVGAHETAAKVVESLNGWSPFGFGGNGGDGSGGSSSSGSSSSGSSSGGSSSNSSDPGAGANVKVVNSVVSYIAQVQVGSPGTTYNLIVDTGSSNTWVGADPQNPYVKTSTSQVTGDSVSVTYGSGQFNGSEFTDTVNLGSGLSVATQSIGAADSSVGFDGVDGILGVGPTDLTEGTLLGAKAQTIPTITDSLLKTGAIDTEVLGVSFIPNVNGQDTANGVLSFGGVDENAFVGDIVFQPITQTAPASAFWGANISLTLDNTPLAPSMAGIVDTGTTLFLMADNFFNAYLKAIPGATFDSKNTGLIQIPIDSMASMPTLNVEWNGATFPLSADAQVFPQALNTALGGTNNFAYSIVSSLGTPSGEGLDFIFGMTALERFYSVFDTTNKQVGLALTQQTNATFFNATPSTSSNTGNNEVAANGSTSGASSTLRLGAGAAWAVGAAGLLAFLV